MLPICRLRREVGTASDPGNGRRSEKENASESENEKKRKEEKRRERKQSARVSEQDREQ